MTDESDSETDGRPSVSLHHPIWRSNDKQTILYYVGYSSLFFVFLALNKLIQKLQERLDASKKTHPSRKVRVDGQASDSMPPVSAPRWAIERSYRHHLRRIDDNSSSSSTSTPRPTSIHSTPTNATLPYYTEPSPTSNFATVPLTSTQPALVTETPPSRGQVTSLAADYGTVPPAFMRETIPFQGQLTSPAADYGTVPPAFMRETIPSQGQLTSPAADYGTVPPAYMRETTPSRGQLTSPRNCYTESDWSLGSLSD